MKKILITGAKGFVGSFLTKSLNYEIHSSTDDILNIDRLDKTFQYIEPDYVIHLAAKVDNKRQESYLQINFLGMINIIKMCLKYKCKLINFSTDCGDKFNDVDSYGYSKSLAEEAVKFFVKNNNLLAITIKPSHLYDSNEKDRFGEDAQVWKGRSYPLTKLSLLLEDIINKHNFNKYRVFETRGLKERYSNIKFKLRSLIK